MAEGEKCSRTGPNQIYTYIHTPWPQFPSCEAATPLSYPPPCCDRRWRPEAFIQSRKLVRMAAEVRAENSLLTENSRFARLSSSTAEDETFTQVKCNWVRWRGTRDLSLPFERQAFGSKGCRPVRERPKPPAQGSPVVDFVRVRPCPNLNYISRAGVDDQMTVT